MSAILNCAKLFASKDFRKDSPDGKYFDTLFQVFFENKSGTLYPDGVSDCLLALRKELSIGYETPEKYLLAEAFCADLSLAESIHLVEFPKYSSDGPVSVVLLDHDDSIVSYYDYGGIVSRHRQYILSPIIES